ncbi:hypothetical protein QR680_000297 [Steinernema hermaphroditum]|uniref:Uncharacterized protein n=1 Tax=Steinernema hermaphroditum TaxID=289476 RepID=A0AA39GU37_9BILA|nr:hypothetical protein QR680_000297 [Steinernema hermaphroditum]
MRPSNVLCIIGFVLMCGEVVSDTECFKYSNGQFAIIKECDYGCVYRFKQSADRSARIDGGCANSRSNKEGCFGGKDGITHCYCTEDRCNQAGYEMPDN